MLLSNCIYVGVVALHYKLEHLTHVVHPILNKIMVIKNMKTSLYKAYERKKQIYSKIS
jgi:hypothetical protein